MTITKAYEVTTLRQWIESLPKESYLRPIMTAVQLDIERAISNDFTVIDYSGFMDSQAAKRKVLVDLEAAIVNAKAELQRLNSEYTRANNAMIELKNMALRIVQVKP